MTRMNINKGVVQLIQFQHSFNIQHTFNIHMYPHFLFAAIHHLNRPRLSLSDLVAQPAE